MNFEHVILPFQDSLSRWDITISDGIVTSMSPSSATSHPDLLLPGLCHAHIHLDKPYLLTCNHPSSASHPDYSDLVPQTGSFDEALTNTSLAKKRFTQPDVYLRGSQLLAASHAQGVTSLRAFVEIDDTVGTASLESAIRLKTDFSHLLHMQICAFAQDPIFSTERGELNRAILSAALDDYGADIDVLGTTPYVEKTEEAGLQNIRWAIETALRYGLHLDFHVEYNLDPGDGLGHVGDVIDFLVAQKWPTGRGAKTVVLGHATRLTQASDRTMADLAGRLHRTRLPVHFVGLPTSDMFMMGRPSEGSPSHARQRGTLNVPLMIREYGLNACVAVNNVGNAFTPYGNGDPLTLASWCVGLYHAGTVDDARLLYECVSSRAREAIGLGDRGEDDAYEIAEGKTWPPMLLVKNERDAQLPGKQPGETMRIPARPRLGIKDVVWDPPAPGLRQVVHGQK
jgi:cytosine/adenosine deaminase-related metal-dependent hydrolase